VFSIGFIWMNSVAGKAPHRETMPMPNEPRIYEFDAAQNATFANLATAMKFVAVAMMILSLVLGAATVVLARSTLAGSAILAPLAVAMGIMAAQQYAAAAHFRRIVATRGNDMSNLMVALEKMVIAYRIQRWLWLTASVAVVIALATTIVGR
jgi:hypothetical protein